MTYKQTSFFSFYDKRETVANYNNGERATEHKWLNNTETFVKLK